MKVHRIITTIEVKNDNSITSIELINLHPTNADIPLAITNLTTNGNADDIKQVYDNVNKHRLGINGKLLSQGTPDGKVIYVSATELLERLQEKEKESIKK